MIKKKLFSLLILIIIIVSVAFYKRDDLKHKLLTSLPSHFQVVLQIINNPERIKHFNNDYNVNFLPKTQFINLNYLEKKLDFESLEEITNIYSNEKEKISYKIGLYKDLIYAIDSRANVKRFKLILNNDGIELIDYKNISTNIENAALVKDFLIHDEIIYMSYILDTKNCKQLKIAKSKINIMPLNFRIIYEPDFCINNLQAASLQFYKHNDNDGLLISTSVEQSDKQSVAQDLKSIQGKILFLNFKNNKPIIFSYGHRNPQGLLALNNIIISTEHGPKGGDEININLSPKTNEIENFGWPIASYGEHYGFKERDDNHVKYKNAPLYKSHSKYGFIEPIKYYVPSIGISEIIQVPNNYFSNTNNNFLIASMGSKITEGDLSIHHISLNDSFNEIISADTIPIGERIRDMIYIKDHKKVFLFLETSASIGILELN